MRHGMNSGLIFDSGQFMGICLGADFCAEHEWGIKKIRRSFGIDAELLHTNKGIARRTVSAYPEDCIVLVEKDNLAILVFSDTVRHCRNRGEEIDPWNWDCTNRELRLRHTERDLEAAWSETDFAIFVRGEENVKHLKELHAALADGDAAIWMGASGPFENGGVNIGILSRLPVNFLKAILDADDDHLRMIEASDGTGIVQRIDKINQESRGSDAMSLGYFALSPRWINGSLDSKYPVMYWLNPMNQREHNCGWFTVEQLEQWIDGNGPVLKEEQDERS